MFGLTNVVRPLTYWTEQQKKDVFHQVEFVDKNYLEAQNPRRDTGVLSVSAGLGVGGKAYADKTDKAKGGE